MEETYYLKAIGKGDHWIGGTCQWLKIRGFKALKNANTGKEYYELQVKTGWGIKYLMVADFNPKSLAFKNQDGMTVTFVRVIKYFKDRGIGLLIS